jgi:catechol 2,3-dioxygenase-like lactoylglutathione lyase family enzyme
METIRFKGPAAYVSDLERSRGFYEGLLGFEVGRVMRHADADIAVAYRVGFSIWLVTHAYWSIFGPTVPVPTVLGHGNWENTFETPRFDEIYTTLQRGGARFAHELRELPWGQHGFRVYDPDGHIIDISETHGALVRRLAAQGRSRQSIAAQVSLTCEQTDAYLAERE